MPMHKVCDGLDPRLIFGSSSPPLGRIGIGITLPIKIARGFPCRQCDTQSQHKGPARRRRAVLLRS
jgi:hypothetical protein